VSCVFCSRSCFHSSSFGFGTSLAFSFILASAYFIFTSLGMFIALWQALWVSSFSSFGFGISLPFFLYPQVSLFYLDVAGNGLSLSINAMVWYARKARRSVLCSFFLCSLPCAACDAFSTLGSPQVYIMTKNISVFLHSGQSIVGLSREDN
jgi:hypothetical protein